MITAILSIIALLLGLVAGYFFGKSGAGASSESIQSIKETYESNIARLQTSHSEAVERFEQTRRDDLARVEQAHREDIDRLEQAHREDISRAELAHRGDIERAEQAHREDIARLEQANKEAADARETFYKDSVELMHGRFDETVAKMQEELKNLTADLLARRQEEFSKSSSESLGKLMEPLESTIRKMNEAVADNSSRQEKLRGEMRANIETIIRESQLPRDSADRLATALRKGTKVQGDWGETVLVELLESQGLKEGIHFHAQSAIRNASGETVRTGSGSSLRPDITLHLDQHRDVVIDSKVSLSAYLDFVNAETEEARAVALAKHVESVRNHVDELARKDYSSYFVDTPTKSIGYVIMFVPSTAALHAATNTAPDLWRKAMERNVYIADEQTLYAALKIVALTWTNIAQAENHKQVFALANEMLERVSIFMEKFNAVGVELEKADKAYREAQKKLADGGQSIPVTCGKLVRLGASVKPRKGVSPAQLGLDLD